MSVSKSNFNVAMRLINSLEKSHVSLSRDLEPFAAKIKTMASSKKSRSISEIRP